MIRDSARRVFDGALKMSGGVDSGTTPDAIAMNQVAFAVNATFDGDYATNRPAYEGLLLHFENDTVETNWNTGKFQGSCFYTAAEGEESLIIEKGGRLFNVSTLDGDVHVSEITIKTHIIVTADFAVPAPGTQVTVSVNAEQAVDVGDTLYIDSGEYVVVNKLSNALVLSYVGSAANPTAVNGTSVLDSAGALLIWEDTNPDDDFAFLFQADRYVLLGQKQNPPIIFDGSTSRRAGIGEIPPFYCAAYIMGRIWYAIPSRKMYGAGDIVGSDSGTSDNGFRDSILKVTENTYLNEGGYFMTPAGAGLITTILSTVVLDTSLGQGTVSVFCENGVFSCNAPVDRTIWKDVTFPIQTVSLVDYGALSARGVVSVNADAWYRSQDGVRSFIIARRDFGGGWGNTPMSFEVNRIIKKDSESLLSYGSAVLFDNRLMMTCSPHRTDYGVYHRGFVVISFDDISKLQAKRSPAWEGLWTGLNIFQVLRGRVNGEEQCYVIALNALNEMQIWRVNRGGVQDYVHKFDKNNDETYEVTPIQSLIEFRSLTFDKPFDPKILDIAEIFVDNIQGNVDFSFSFRPDQYPCWIPWHSWSECTKITHCNEDCPDIKNFKPGYRPSMRVPTPPETCLTMVNKMANHGYQFQPRLAWTGKARIKQVRVQALLELNETSGDCR